MSGKNFAPTENLTKRAIFARLRLLKKTLNTHKATGLIKMAKAKNDIKMVSSAGTGFFYVTTKNPKNNTKKLELKKYDPRVRKHVAFKEGKIKEGKK